MTVPKFRVYIATSLDGYIADAQGSVAWLDRFDDGVYGYQRFLDSIDAIVVGRTTFEQILSFGEWPYPGKHTLVLTRRKAPPVEIPDVQYVAGEIEGVVAAVADYEQVWVLGGGDAIGQFLAAGRIDEMEIFIMPTILGGGIGLFSVAKEFTRLTLQKAEPCDHGVVRLTYTIAQST